MDGQDDEEEEEEEEAQPVKKSAKKPVGNGGAKGKVNGGKSGDAGETIGTDVKTLLGRIKKLERSVYEVSFFVSLAEICLRFLSFFARSQRLGKRLYLVTEGTDP